MSSSASGITVRLDVNRASPGTWAATIHFSSLISTVMMSVLS